MRAVVSGVACAGLKFGVCEIGLGVYVSRVVVVPMKGESLVYGTKWLQYE